jgi:large subunit ribosomal protein L15
MELDSMKPARGSRKPRKRIGRGPGSGTGKTSARGHKGQGARAGGNVGTGFEGGQMPLARRLPKRGFKNRFRVSYQVINLSDLAGFAAGSEVDPQVLREAGMAKRSTPVKILGSGKVEASLTVRAHAFSKSAVAAITAAGGKTEVIAAKRGDVEAAE